MLTTGAVLLLLVIASITDLRQRKVLNSTTYPGMLLGLAVNAAASLAGWGLAGGSDPSATWGLVGFGESLAGLFGCGMAMIVAYVLFAGGVGGGDVKLIAMMGAWLGIYQGIEAMLWTFVLAGCLAIIVLIWRVGFWRLMSQVFRNLFAAIRLGSLNELKGSGDPNLKTDLFLAPSALAATVIVRFRLIEGVW